MYKLVKLKNENHSEKLVILLQSQIRGYLQRRSLVVAFNATADKIKNPEMKNIAALTIQRHWRSYKSRKFYRELLNEQSTKNVQFKFFCQQVYKTALILSFIFFSIIIISSKIELLVNDIYMWTIKSNYQVNSKDLMVIPNDFNKSQAHLKLSSNSSNRLHSKISNGCYLNEEIKNKITRNLEQKASMINSTNVIYPFSFLLFIFLLA